MPFEKRSHGIEPLESRIAPAVLTVQAPAEDVLEGASGENRSLVFKVVLDAPSVTDITFQASTINGTAVAGRDFTAITNQSFTIPAGQTEISVPVAILGDDRYEAAGAVRTEDLQLEIRNPGTGNSIAGTGRQTGRIIDDDILPTVSIAPATVREGSGGFVNLEFVVTRTGLTDVATTFLATTADGTATAGTTGDYLALTNLSVIIPATAAASSDPVTTQTVRVQVRGDLVVEPDETLTLTLSNLSQAVFAGGQPTLVATGTIINDDPILTLGSISVLEGNSGFSGARLVASLSSPATQDVTFKVRTVNGTAEAGSDYVAITDRLFTIAAGFSSVDVPVTVIADTTDEPDETFTVEISDVTNAFVNGTAPLSATVTLRNDDFTVGVGSPGSTAFSVVEGTTGERNIDFVVRLDGPARGYDITVNYEVVDGTANAGSDYTAANGQITFAAGETEKTISVTVKGDTELEVDETVLLRLTNAINAQISRSQGTGTILNDDVLITIADATIIEGDEGENEISFPVRLVANGTFSSNVRVDFATIDGTAISTPDSPLRDFIATSGTLDFAPGETLKNITVRVVGDRIVDFTDRFTVALTNAVNATISTPSATGTIIDNEAGTVRILAGGGHELPGNAGRLVMPLVANAVFDSDVVIVLKPGTPSTGTGTPAGIPEDVMIPSTLTVTLPAGSTTVNAEYVIVSDAVPEGDEVVQIVVDSATTIAGGVTNLVTVPDAGKSAIGTIRDGITVGFTAGQYSVGEAGPGTLPVRVELSSPAVVPVVVTIAHEATQLAGAIPATAGVDYNSSEIRVTIPAGQRGVDVNLAITNDTLYESPEAFGLRITGATQAVLGSRVFADVVISSDDPAPGFSWSAAGPVVEGALGQTVTTGRFVATLSAAADTDITFDVAFTGTATSGTDYAPITVTSYTIAKGQRTLEIPVTVIGDALQEGDETIVATISNVRVAGLTTGLPIPSSASATLVIQDDEATVSFSAETFSGAENSGLLPFIVNLSQALSNPVTVHFTVPTQSGLANPATVGSDYTVPTTLSIVIPAGSTSGTFNIPLVDNAAHEVSPELFRVNISRVEGAVPGAIVAANGSITDDDPQPALSVSDVTVNEGQVATFRVTLSQASDAPVSFRWRTENSASQNATPGVDFTEVSTPVTISIPAGQTEATFQVMTINDPDEEGVETFRVVLSDPTGATISDGEGIGTIRYNDSITVNAVVDKPNGAREGTTDNGSFNFVIQAQGAHTQPITVAYVITGLTATAGTDFTVDRLSGEVTLAPGVNEIRLPVTIVGDNVIEGNETLQITLSQPADAANSNLSLGIASATATILDDDVLYRLTPVGTVDSSGNISANEGQRVQFIVKRVDAQGNTPSFALPAGTVSLELIPGTATADDFSRAAGTNGTGNLVVLSFPAQAAGRESTASFSLNLNTDTSYERAESFTVALVGGSEAPVAPVNGADLTPGATVVTINNVGVAPTVSVGNVILAEGNLAQGQEIGTTDFTFTIQLSAPAGAPVTVNYATRDLVAGGTILPGDIATSTGENADYTPVSGSVVIPSGSTSATVTVAVNKDALVEKNEQFELVVTSAEIDFGANGKEVLVAADAATKPFGRATITNDDSIQLSIDPVNPVTEGTGGTTDAVAMIRLSAPAVSDFQVLVRVTASGSSPVVLTGPNADIVGIQGGTGTDPLSKLITIPAGQTSVPVTVRLATDRLAEPSETFTISLASPEIGTVSSTNGSVEVTIIDDDPAPTFTIDSVTITEGDSGTQNAVFTVTLFGAVPADVTVNYSTAGSGSAPASSSGPLPDFTAVSGTLTFSAAESATGTVTRTISVPVHGDTFAERDETFEVRLSSPSGGVSLAQAVGTGTILNGNDTTVGVFLTGASGSEASVGGVNATQAIRVELSMPRTTATVVTLAPRSLSAVLDVDFQMPTAARTVTIPSGSISANATVTIVSDNLFEGFEQYAVDVATVPSGLQIVPGGGTAIGSILDDDTFRSIGTNRYQYIEPDGDIIEVRITQGNLTSSMFRFVTDAATGGRLLQSLDLTQGGTGRAAQFDGASLAITLAGVTRPDLSDRQATVGQIVAAEIDSNFEIVRGADFTALRVEGSLQRIIAGDDVPDPAFGRFEVNSLGEVARRPDGSALLTGDDASVSTVLAGIRNMVVHRDFAGQLNVLGSSFGSIGALEIGGTLRGGTANGSGSIFFTGSIGTAVIGGIVGGSGGNSGGLYGSGNFVTAIRALMIGHRDPISGRLVADGDLVGGSGTNSGVVLANRITALALDSITGGSGTQSGSIVATSALGTFSATGKITGGSGTNSGAVEATAATRIMVAGEVAGGDGGDSGRINVPGNVVQVTTGRINGGDGNGSGVLIVGGNVNTVILNGNLAGGAGDDSGVLNIGGALGVLRVNGDLTSLGTADNGGVRKSLTGSILAGSVGSLTITGALRPSQDESGNLLTSNSSIRIGTTARLIDIGEIDGNSTQFAVITAGREIASLRVRGDVQFADILAGVSARLVDTRSPGSDDVANTARIGTVLIQGNMAATNIAAGVQPVDGVFGNSDDAAANINDTTISRIASVVVTGQVTAPTSTVDGSYGIVARFVGAVRIGGAAVPLIPGAGNDRGGTPVEIGATGSRTFVSELRLAGATV